MDISQEIIDAWKLEHGQIFKKIISGTTFIYRVINRKDFVDLQELIESNPVVDAELETVKKVILNNVDHKILESKGGIVRQLYEDVLNKSGFDVSESEEL